MTTLFYIISAFFIFYLIFPFVTVVFSLFKKRFKIKSFKIRNRKMKLPVAATTTTHLKLLSKRALLNIQHQRVIDHVVTYINCYFFYKKNFLCVCVF